MRTAVFAVLLLCAPAWAFDRPPRFEAPTLELSVEPSEIQAGDVATVRWSTEHADTCVASGAGQSAPVPVEAEMSSAFSETTRITVQCDGPGGRVSESVVVTVTEPAPEPEPQPDPDPEPDPEPNPPPTGDWPEDVPAPWAYNAPVSSWQTVSGSGDRREITCNGSPDALAGVRLDIDGPNERLTISGSWCAIEGSAKGYSLRVGGDHMVIRGLEHDGASRTSRNATLLSGTDIVLADSHIHHHQGDDRHGIHVGSGSDRVWIIGNEVHHNGGDGYQACHGCSSNPPRNVYIVRNEFYSDRENSVDLKYSENVWIVENVMHSLVSAPKDERWCFDDGSGCGTFSSGSDGSAIVIGSDGAPNNVKVLRNEITSTNVCVRIEEGFGVEIRDNECRQVGVGLLVDKRGDLIPFTGNLIEDAQRGIHQNWRENFAFAIDGNTFRNVSGPVIEIESGAVFQNSTLTNNVFENTGPVIYGNQTYQNPNDAPGASGNQ